jgi:hypothetical protein
MGSLLSSFVAKADGPNMNLHTELIATLDGFAKQHSLTGSELERMLGAIVLEDKKMKKGGVGIIDKDTFILLNEKRNSLMISNRKWEGKESSQQEVLLIDGQHILSTMDGVDLSKILIVIFTPSEVRFINLGSSIAGIYSR